MYFPDKGGKKYDHHAKYSDVMMKSDESLLLSDAL
jgi:hypothetical protein